MFLMVHTVIRKNRIVAVGEGRIALRAFQATQMINLS